MPIWNNFIWFLRSLMRKFSFFSICLFLTLQSMERKKIVTDQELIEHCSKKNQKITSAIDDFPVNILPSVTLYLYARKRFYYLANLPLPYRPSYHLTSIERKFIKEGNFVKTEDPCADIWILGTKNQKNILALKKAIFTDRVIYPIIAQINVNDKNF